MISIIYYARNDEHGGNFLKRLKASFYTNIYLLEKNKIDSEIIMVDYNTPDNEQKLYEVLHINKLKYVKIRYIIVPPSFHKQFNGNKKLPMNFNARNIGIRRSKGDFILSTCSDVIFSNELVLKLKNLKEDKIYRVNRYDVNNCFLEFDLNYEEILDFCKKNIIDIHFNTNKGNFIPNTKIPMLHTNNCGDFQLAHKNIWFKLRGYPEIDLMGTHIDTLFEYMVYLSGYQEEIWEEKIFHIDHPSRWLKPLYTHVLRNWRLLFKDLGYEAIKYKEEYYKLAKKISNDASEKTYLEEIDFKILSDDEYKQAIADMVNGKRSIVYNDKNWGAKDYNFKEVVSG